MRRIIVLRSVPKANGNVEIAKPLCRTRCHYADACAVCHDGNLKIHRIILYALNIVNLIRLLAPEWRDGPKSGAVLQIAASSPRQIDAAIDLPRGKKFAPVPHRPAR